MSTTQPIRDKEALRKFKNFYKTQKPNPRNYAIIVLGLNTALRISDILNLTSEMVYDNNKVREHIVVKEQKTGKINRILLNREVRKALNLYHHFLVKSAAYKTGNPYLFPSPYVSQRPLSRYQVYRMIRNAAESVKRKGESRRFETGGTLSDYFPLSCGASSSSICRSFLAAMLSGCVLRWKRKTLRAGMGSSSMMG